MKPSVITQPLKVKVPMASHSEKLRKQLADIRDRRAAVIADSTKKKLERLDEEERSTRDMLESAERVESRAKHSIPPSPEESALWEEIKDLMGREAAILHEKMIPERYVRADSLEHFAGDLKERVEAFEKESSGLKFSQTHGPRVIAKRNELAAEQQNFTTKIKPLCLIGQKLHGIRDQIKTLTERRDAMKAERESQALASVK